MFHHCDTKKYQENQVHCNKDYVPRGYDGLAVEGEVSIGMGQTACSLTSMHLFLVWSAKVLGLFNKQNSAQLEKLLGRVRTRRSVHAPKVWTLVSFPWWPS